MAEKLSVAERLSAVETDVKSLGRSMDGVVQSLKQQASERRDSESRLSVEIQQGIAKLSAALVDNDAKHSAATAALESKVGQVGKTDFRTLLTMSGSIVVLVTLLWGVAIAPIKQAVTNMEGEVHNNSVFRERQPAIDAEQETQFRGAATLRNEQLQTQDRTNQIFWQKLFPGETYPERRLYPTIGANGH